MKKENRLEQIQDLLADGLFVNRDKICSKMGINISTLRSYMKILIDKKICSRMYVRQSGNIYYGLRK